MAAGSLGDHTALAEATVGQMTAVKDHLHIGELSTGEPGCYICRDLTL